MILREPLDEMKHPPPAGMDTHARKMRRDKEDIQRLAQRVRPLLIAIVDSIALELQQWPQKGIEDLSKALHLTMPQSRDKRSVLSRREQVVQHLEQSILHPDQTPPEPLSLATLE